MRSLCVVVLGVLGHHAAEMVLVEDDEVIQAFVSGESDEAFSVGV